jgi:hypothetical protein
MVMTGKRYFLPASEIQPGLAAGFGSCIASDRITVDGRPVGFLYREVPDSSLDSGWRFFAGDESQAYVDRPDNLALYDVNTIANYDRSIVGLLDSPVGSAFGRNAAGEFVLERMPEEPDVLNGPVQILAVRDRDT